MSSPIQRLRPDSMAESELGKSKNYLDGGEWQSPWQLGVRRHGFVELGPQANTENKLAKLKDWNKQQLEITSNPMTKPGPSKSRDSDGQKPKITPDPMPEPKPAKLPDSDEEEPDTMSDATMELEIANSAKLSDSDGQEPETTLDVTTEHEPAQQTATNDNVKGHGRKEYCRWNLTHDQQVQNLVENWKKAFTWFDLVNPWDDGNDTDPWFPSIVSQLRVNPRLNSYEELEIDEVLIGGLVSDIKMRSLDVAILMGDLQMVQKILHNTRFLKQLLRGLLVNEEYGSTDFIERIDPKKRGFLYTPLHLAVAVGNSKIVGTLLNKGANIYTKNWLHQSPLYIAYRMGNVVLLQQLLKKDREKRDVLHIAVQHGDVKFMEKVPNRKVQALDRYRRTPLHYLAAYAHYNHHVMTAIVKFLTEKMEIDMKALDDSKFSALYVAILLRNTKLVIVLTESFSQKIRLNEACDEDLGPPIQIAFERGKDYKDIESALMECDAVKGYMERLYRDRQLYVDAANAILVGAALIAGITFASWLQPPLNYTSYSGEGYSSSSSSDLNYADVEHNIALRAFWIFNALSFYFAIGSVVSGARSVLPRSHLFIGKTVEKLHTNLLVTSVLLACSVLFVLIAFAIAGTIVLTPLLKYQWYMIVPTLVGGMVCIISLVLLVKSMVGNSFNTRDYTNLLNDLDRQEYLKDSNVFYTTKSTNYLDHQKIH